MDRQEALDLCFHLMELGFLSWVIEDTGSGFSVGVGYEGKGYVLKKNARFFGKTCI